LYSVVQCGEEVEV